MMFESKASTNKGAVGGSTCLMNQDSRPVNGDQPSADCTALTRLISVFSLPAVETQEPRRQLNLEKCMHYVH